MCLRLLYDMQTYDDYIETYEASQALWQRVFKKHGYIVEEGQDQMPKGKAGEDRVEETDAPLPVEMTADFGHSEGMQPSRDDTGHSANPSDAGITGLNSLAPPEPPAEGDGSVPPETEQEAFAVVVKQELEM